jgi:hypothetical protein
MRGKRFQDVFEVLGTAYREGERMLDRMQYLIGGTAELREHGGSLADTLISPCCSTRPSRRSTSGRAVKEKIARRASSPPGELGDTSAWASKRPGPPAPAHAAEPGGAEGRGRAVAAVDKIRDAASARDN